MPPTYLAVVLIVSAFLPPSLAQYGPPAVKGKKHRTTTTTPLPPDIQGINLGQAYPGYNPISSTPLPDNSLGSYNPPPQDGGSYWWQNPNSPFSGATAPAPGPSPAPQPQPQPQPGYPGGCGAGGAGGCGGTPQQPVNIQGNPFLSGLKPGGGAVPPIQPTGQTITCSGPGNVCVPKNQCSNGVVVTDGRGSFDVRSEVQYCDAVSQACCRVPSGGNRPSGGCGGYGSGAGCGQPAQQPSPYPGQPAPQPSYPGQPAPQPSYPGQPAPQPSPYPGQPAPQPSPYPGQPSGGNQNAGPGLVHIPPSPAGPSHPSNGAQYPSASIPSPTYSPPGNNYGRPGTNGIPIGGSIYDGAGRPPVTQAPQQPYTGPQNTTPHPGCAAALKCVPESYCTAEGVMANSPVTLTREQYENRVPLSDCADPDTGAIGKCCRDPNYKDPWPGGMMMMKGGNGGGAQLPQQQFPPQQPQNECGSSASCQHPYQCADHLRVQPTKGCINPQDGQTGVCCSTAYQYPTQTYSNPQYPSQTYENSQYSPQYPAQAYDYSQYPSQTYDNSEFRSQQPVSSPQKPRKPSRGGAECGIRRQVSRQGLADTDAGFSEFPWQALVVSSSDQKPLCSAVIISDRAVITAAHCLQNLESNDIAVQAGVWKLNSLNPPKPSQTSHVAAISRHPKFDAGSLFNDLAVLVLSQPLKFDEHIDKICLPPKGQDISQLRGVCTATGWGKPAIQGNVPGSILHQIPVQLIPHNTCEEKLRQTHLGRYFILNPSFQCAVPAGPSQDLCKVDAGGPIACDRGDGHLMLSGLYSWDVGCSVPNSPTVLGGIDTDWIESVLARPVDDLVRDELNDILKQQQQEELGGVDIDNKPGFSQGYGKK
ncbi:hypothetical protein C0J52_05279 [Blattella germanica]|nr:hypothetical protein C0J52_05279 [Blattella germanica]